MEDRPQTADDVTAICKRDLASHAITLVSAAITDLVFGEFLEEARALEAVAPAIAKAAGWTIWASKKL